MKKVININFQGRVIPIEETAFELLKQYIESLRRYFAGEEGREEIINDIQDRIGELFNDCLKAGATCVTDADLGKIIDNMGRPEDFEAAENDFADQVKGSASGSEATGTSGSYAGAGKGSTEKSTGHGSGSQGGYEPRGRLYRNESDKVLGGVCSGLANYLKIDPVIIRILYVIMVFGSFGAAVLVYFVLWVVLPPQSLDPTIRKRLFRSPEDRMIGGVCGGIAAYFNLEVWIPRLIFAAPFIFGVLGAILRVTFWWQWHDFPITIFNGFGGSLLVVYIILWAVLPEARTASERLEMRGAKIDLESIRASVQEEIQGLKERAIKAGGEFSEKAQAWGEEIKTGSRKFAKEAAPAARRSGSGVLHAIGMLFKIFFLIIAGIIAFSILMALIAVLFGSIGAYPLADIFLQGFWPHFFFWSTLTLFLGIPVIAIFHWIIRMIIGRRSENNYFRYIFATLWLLGFVSAICLAGMVFRSVRAGNVVSEHESLTQPSKNGLVVRVRNEGVGSDSWTWGVQLNGLIENNGDNLLHVYNVQMNVGQSPDGNYHMELQKHSRGSDPVDATDNATKIQYNFTQEDSIVYLSRTLALTAGQPFRGQGVRVNILVPVGKHIFLDESLDRLEGYNVRIWKNKWDTHDWDGDGWDDNEWNWETGVDYIMTKDGLIRADGKKVLRNGDDDEDNHADENKDDNGDDDKPAAPATRDTAAAGAAHQYRYHQGTPATEPAKPAKPAAKPATTAPVDTAKPTMHAEISRKDAEALPNADNVTSPFYHISCAL
jgi:phage shock protein PspC (stress-responsive transcriptional regulator)